MIPPRFPISEQQIDSVVAEFYGLIRQHPALGPVFANHVADWPEHEAKIARFWKNAILFQRVYDGNPMAAHMQAGDVRPGMFGPWLGLFDSVLECQLSPETAAAWSALAHRIGAGLRYGLLDEGPRNQPPSLR